MIPIKNNKYKQKAKNNGLVEKADFKEKMKEIINQFESSPLQKLSQYSYGRIQKNFRSP